MAVVDERGDGLGREDVGVQGRLPVLPGIQVHPAHLVQQPELLQRDDRLRIQGSRNISVTLHDACPMLQTVSPTNAAAMLARVSGPAPDLRAFCACAVAYRWVWATRIERGHQQVRDDPTRPDKALDTVCRSARAVTCLVHPMRLSGSSHPPSNLPCSTRINTVLCDTCALSGVFVTETRKQRPEHAPLHVAAV